MKSKGHIHVISVIVMWDVNTNIPITLTTVYDIMIHKSMKKLHQVDFQLMPLSLIEIAGLFWSCNLQIFKTWCRWLCHVI